MFSLFQYISCYCLSQILSVCDFVSPSFQYISCYCLSGTEYENKRIIKHISIHLMLLFILVRMGYHPANYGFQYISCYCLSGRDSHTSTTFAISIHLMLLFIEYDNHLLLSKHLFQYISCYCLSREVHCFEFSLSISIHLMLLFIADQRKKAHGYVNFNTSHVTVYLIFF